MITRLFNNPRILYQKASGEFDLPEAAIGASVDNAGIIVLEQEGRHVLINRQSVPELCRLLKEQAKA